MKHCVEAARNHEILKKNRDIFNRSIFNFEGKIMMLGATIRKSGIHSCSETILKAMDGCQLHSGLVNFYITAKENCLSYIKIGADTKLYYLRR